ncbi:DsbA family protein [Ferrovibrio sp.]|uniref:DsbA family protein n=1 Tax=Ferrovibrio sp. TaxID=1917215 RepID=UPI003D13A5EB
MNRRHLIIGVSALGVTAFAAGTLYWQQRREQEAAIKAATTPPAEESTLIRPHSPIIGPRNAPVTLVEFFDPSCEACRAYHPYLKALHSEFPTQFRTVMRYTPFHKGSDEAVRILETARMQGKFETVLDALLAQQPHWAMHGNPALDVAWEVAGIAGLDLERAKAERLHPDITALLNQDMADVREVQIRFTPTFFLNGERLEVAGPRDLTDRVRNAVRQGR